MKITKKLLSIIIALSLLVSFGIPALAKTSSEVIDDPSDATIVFTVKAAGKTVGYTWADVSGTGKFKTATYGYGAKDANDNPIVAEWTGVMLSAILSDVQEQLGMTFADDYKVKTITVDNYPSTFTVGAAKDMLDGRHMVCTESVKNFDGDKTYDNSYVRIMCGAEDAMPNKSSIRCLVGIEVLDASGNELTGSDENSQAGAVAFTDIGDYGWAADAINYLAAEGIIKGVGDNKFAPGNNMKRGDFILILMQTYKPEAKPDGNFDDVPAGSYYYDAIATAKALGIAQGDGKNFRPNDPITRQDAMVLMTKMLEIAGKKLDARDDLSAFSDVSSISGYALDAVKALVGAGIINGSNGEIKPLANITRAEVAVIVYKTLTVLG